MNTQILVIPVLDFHCFPIFFEFIWSFYKYPSRIIAFTIPLNQHTKVNKSMNSSVFYGLYELCLENVFQLSTFIIFAQYLRETKKNILEKKTTIIMKRGQKS